MTSRPAAHVVRRFPAPSGEHPNKYIPWITCDLRVFWTPETKFSDIATALDSASLDLHTLIKRRHEAGR